MHDAGFSGYNERPCAVHPFQIHKMTDTFPKLLIQNAERFANKPAIREKDLGIWRTYSWADYAKQVERFALGLSAAGAATITAVALNRDPPRTEVSFQ